MNESAPSNDSESTPFEKLQDFTRQMLAVPKAEIDRREAAWKAERARDKGDKGLTETPKKID